MDRVFAAFIGSILLTATAGYTLPFGGVVFGACAYLVGACTIALLVDRGVIRV